MRIADLVEVEYIWTGGSVMAMDCTKSVSSSMDLPLGRYVKHAPLTGMDLMERM